MLLRLTFHGTSGRTGSPGGRMVPPGRPALGPAVGAKTPASLRGAPCGHSAPRLGTYRIGRRWRRRPLPVDGPGAPLAQGYGAGGAERSPSGRCGRTQTAGEPAQVHMQPADQCHGHGRCRRPGRRRARWSRRLDVHPQHYSSLESSSVCWPTITAQCLCRTSPYGLTRQSSPAREGGLSRPGALDRPPPAARRPAAPTAPRPPPGPARCTRAARAHPAPAASTPASPGW